ncbi:hypothetical protein HN51_005171 [Arachis hypogaea]
MRGSDIQIVQRRLQEFLNEKPSTRSSKQRSPLQNGLKMWSISFIIHMSFFFSSKEKPSHLVYPLKSPCHPIKIMKAFIMAH